MPDAPVSTTPTEDGKDFVINNYKSDLSDFYDHYFKTPYEGSDDPSKIEWKIESCKLGYQDIRPDNSAEKVKTAIKDYINKHVIDKINSLDLRLHPIQLKVVVKARIMIFCGTLIN